MDTGSYDLGIAYGHIGVKGGYVSRVKINEGGGKVVRATGTMKHGSTVLAFVEDPNGDKIELLSE